MLTVATVLAVLVLPAAAVTVLLLTVGRVQRAREERITHQVGVTDALHAELGAVVSPVVKRRFRRGWRIEIAVPFERAAMVGRVVAIAQSAMVRADARAADRVKVVLTAQEVHEAVGVSRSATASPGRTERWGVWGTISGPPMS